MDARCICNVALACCLLSGCTVAPMLAPYVAGIGAGKYQASTTKSDVTVDQYVLPTKVSQLDFANKMARKVAQDIDYKVEGVTVTPFMTIVTLTKTQAGITIFSKTYRATIRLTLQGDSQTVMIQPNIYGNDFEDAGGSVENIVAKVKTSLATL